MKQNEILAAVLIGLLVTVVGWILVNNFISKPEERFEEVQQVRVFAPEFDSDALRYLENDTTNIYTLDLDVERSIGSGNDTPFTGQ